MEDIRYCLESFHMKLSFPQHCFFHPTDALHLALTLAGKEKCHCPPPPLMTLVPRGYNNVNGYFCPPSDLCRLLPLITLPSDLRTWAQGLLWLEPLLGPVGSCPVWLGHTQTFPWPRAPVHLNTSHFWVPRDQLFTSNSSDLAHTTSQTSEHWAFFWLSDKALKK